MFNASSSFCCFVGSQNKCYLKNFPCIVLTKLYLMCQGSKRRFNGLLLCKNEKLEYKLCCCEFKNV